MTFGGGGVRGPSLTSVPGLSVGHAQDGAARTGCTAVLGPFRAAVEVRGLATGSRELDALSPLHVVPRCDALLLTGGSAFGLAAADGVVRWLEERGRGFATGAARVPIVPAAVIYDLGVGDADVRPDPAMGYEACDSATAGPVAEGALGAGCGATLGKLRGGSRAEPSGVGSAADGEEAPAVGALAVVNAFGDVLDGRGRILAGTRDDDGAFVDTAAALRGGALPPGFRERAAEERGVGDDRTPEDGDGAGPGASGGVTENTTLGVVATEAALDRTALQVVARQAMNGLVRRVSPAATPLDGDLVFALSTARPEDDDPPRGGRAEVLGVALRAERALERAIGRAVTAPGSGRARSVQEGS